MSTQASVLNVSERLDKLYEFDREPIPTSKLYGGWHFAGLYAGECTAATEFCHRSPVRDVGSQRV